MEWVFILLMLLMISMICVKIGSVALRMTGMDQETASFQSLSAFSGTGSTTRESESITKDRRRRKITKALMIAGNVGLAVAIVALFQAIEKRYEDSRELLAKSLLAVVGVSVLYWLSIGEWVNRWLSRFIERRLASVTDLASPHYSHVLKLGKGYGISEIWILDGHPAIGKTLQDLAWGSRGALVLAIERGNELFSSPGADTKIQDGDEIVCYGPVDKVRRIAASKAGGSSGRYLKPKGS